MFLEAILDCGLAQAVTFFESMREIAFDFAAKAARQAPALVRQLDVDNQRAEGHDHRPARWGPAEEGAAWSPAE